MFKQTQQEIAQFLRKETFERLSNYIGNANDPFRYQSIYTAIVWSPDERNVPLEQIERHHIIIMNKSTPLFKDDKFFYMWIRNSCPSLFGTGTIPRGAEEWPFGRTQFGTYDDIELFTRTFGSSEEKRQAQYMISLTLSEDEILSLKHFQEDHIEKYIYRTPKMKSEDNQELFEFYRKNHIKILEPQNSVRDAFKETLKIAQNFPVINDLGPKNLEECLDIIEYMVITVYRGNLNEKYIGGEMPKMKKFMEYFKLIYQSQEFPQHEGSIIFYVLLNKKLI